jgi:hypothetical protein
MLLLPGVEILNSRVTGFLQAPNRPFGRLQMWFLKVHENLGSRVSGKHRAPFRHFGGWKMQFLTYREIPHSRVTGYW